MSHLVGRSWLASPAVEGVSSFSLRFEFRPDHEFVIEQVVVDEKGKEHRAAYRMDLGVDRFTVDKPGSVEGSCQMTPRDGHAYRCKSWDFEIGGKTYKIRDLLVPLVPE